MTAASRARVGDRVERAIEDRADVEQAIERGEAQPRPRADASAHRAIWLAITGVSLYLVFPACSTCFSSWQDLGEFGVGWLGAMAALQLATLACLWALQHAGHPRAAVAAGDRLAARRQRAVEGRPGRRRGRRGAAVPDARPGGRAARDRRLRPDRGQPARLRAVLGLPVLAVPTIIRGGVDHGLVQATIVGAVVFVALFAVGAVLPAFDAPAALHRPHDPARAQPAAPRTPNRSPACPRGCCTSATGSSGPSAREWKRALLATVGRWAFDYATLLAALAAVGSHPRPGARPARLLRRADPGADPGHARAGSASSRRASRRCSSSPGVPAGAAVLATFAYRLFSYWLPLPLGRGQLRRAQRRRYPAPG